MKNRVRTGARLSFGLLLFMAFAMFTGCSTYIAPLRPYQPTTIKLSSIRFVPAENAVQGQETLGLDEATTLAMVNNYSLRVARIEIDSAEGQLLQAKLLENPEIEFGILSSSAVGSVLSIAGSLLQPIPLFWPKRQVTIAVAEASVEKAKAEVQKFEWELRTSLKKAYLQTILKQNERNLFSQSLAFIENLSEATARLKAGGEVSRLNELLVNSEVVTAKARMIEIESELIRKKSELAAMMGVEVLPPLPEGTLEFPATLIFNPTQLSQTFAASNVELYLRDAEIRLATLEQTAATKTWWPTPKLGVSRERDEENNRLIGGNLSIELPIFNRHQGESLVRDAALRKAQIERDKTEFVGKHTLNRLTILFDHAMQLISLYQGEGLAAVEENLQLVQKAISGGELSILELITARQQAITMKLSYLQTQNACLEILLDLEAVLGTFVFEFHLASTAPRENVTS